LLAAGRYRCARHKEYVQNAIYRDHIFD
jgi:hypothetical protein